MQKAGQQIQFYYGVQLLHISGIAHHYRGISDKSSQTNPDIYTHSLPGRDPRRILSWTTNDISLPEGVIIKDKINTREKGDNILKI